MKTLADLEAGKAPQAARFKRALDAWGDYDHLNVEEFYVLADLKARLSTRGLADDVRYLIMKTLDHALAAPRTGPHDSFVKTAWRLSGKDGRRLAIITTNWDILWDNAIRRISDAKRGPHLSYGTLDTYRSNSVPGTDAAKASYRLLKLHGSLSWWCCPDHQTIDVAADTKAVLAYYESGKGPECPNGQQPDERPHSMEPFFIPPSAQKFESDGPSEPMRQLWRMALDELRNAETLHVVGYSFPELDVQFRMLLIQALKENKQLRKIDIVTSKKLGAERVQFEERLRSTFGGLDHYRLVTVNDGGFETWAKR